VSYDWLLFLHVLAAFTMVAGATLFMGVLLALRRRPDTVIAARLAPAATILWGVGSLAAIVFGIWLALHVSAYSLTDGWIIAAIVLWAVGGAIGGRIGKGYSGVRDGGIGAMELNQLTIMNVVLAIVMLAILYDMIYKPGLG
jgi:uncharacterized membrane protein